MSQASPPSDALIRNISDTAMWAAVYRARETERAYRDIEVQVVAPVQQAKELKDRLTLSYARLLVVLSLASNDTASADTLSRELSARPGFGAGLVLGFTAARGANVRPKIVRAWARFRRRAPFWE